jgi:hypothetical protein
LKALPIRDKMVERTGQGGAMRTREIFLTMLSIFLCSSGGWAQGRAFARAEGWAETPAPRMSRPIIDRGEASRASLGARESRGGINAQEPGTDLRDARRPGRKWNPGFTRGDIFISPFFNPFYSPYSAPMLTPFPFNAILNGFLNPYAAEFGLSSPSFLGSCGFSCQPFVGFDFAEPPAGQMNAPVGNSLMSQSTTSSQRASTSDSLRVPASTTTNKSDSLAPRAVSKSESYSVPAPLDNEPLVIESGYDSGP